MATKPTKLPNDDASLLDRVLGVIAPKKLLERERARFEMERLRVASAVMSGYVGGRYDKNSTRQWFVLPASADADTVFDLHALRARSRDLVRNTPIATGAIGTYVASTVGSGLSLKCTPDYEALDLEEDAAEEWCEATEREFKMWSESTECDITRTQNFYGLQALAFRSMLESGDVFALLPFKQFTPSTMPYQLKIQLIEADRVDTPTGTAFAGAPIAMAPTGITDSKQAGANKIVSGVEIDEFGAPVAYHVSSQHPSEFIPGSKMSWKRMAAFGAKTGRRNVLHVYDRLRPGQSRGVPLLAPVIDSLKQLDRYSESELMAAVVTALFTAFVTTADGGALETGFADEETSSLLAPAPAGGGGGKIGMGNGSVVSLLPGEQVNFADPKRPSGAFEPFVSAVLRQIGVAIGMPYEILIKHFTASYSASRAAILEAWRIFKQRRDFISSQFCNPVFEAFLEEAILLGRISAPGFFDDPAIRRAYLACEWVGDAPTQIDPLKEAQASQLKMEIGLSDLPAEIMELRGKDWKDVHRVQVKVKEARVAAGLEAPINAVVPPKVAHGEGLDAPTKTNPDIPPEGQPPAQNGSDTEQGDTEK